MCLNENDILSRNGNVEEELVRNLNQVMQQAVNDITPRSRTAQSHAEIVGTLQEGLSEQLDSIIQESFQQKDRWCSTSKPIRPISK